MNQQPPQIYKRAAFTLLEIMTVVVIIGIVAGMAVMVMDPFKLRNDVAEDMTKTTISNAKSAVVLYQMKEGKKPSSWDEMTSTGYIEKIPQDGWNKPLELKNGIITSTGGESGKIITSEDL